MCVHPLQEQFIELCKSLYNLFSQEPEEQQLYHSTATVASLLLRLGEVGKRFNCKKGAEPEAASPPAPEGEQEGNREDSQLTGGRGRGQGSLPDADWSITFEQVLASLLTEPPLVDYFERKRDVGSRVAACGAQRGALERQISSASSDHELAQQSV